ICRQHIDAGGEKPHPEFHWIIARCHLADGASDEAVKALGLAVESGWDSVDELLADFSPLAEHPSWRRLLEQTQKNAEAQPG
ncbi:MAG: hypothetical protein JNL42_07055, partial [Anaerolineae bacterium]|nr:hypothetical protein [Anaerolineae bacterium]